MHYILYSLLLFFLSFTLYAHAQHQSFGKIVFITSANSAAQSLFENAVLQLHSFEYEEARQQFIKVQQLDPNFALGYWGEAMTYNHPLWNEQDFKAGRFALRKYARSANARVSKAKTDKEKGFMNAINFLYGDGSKNKRDMQYANQMRELYKAFPYDDEAASFYALALLGSAENGRDYRIYMQAAGVVDEIYNRNPMHPGALHYAIHSFDDPIHAPLGLRAARIYAKTAQSAPHALHMPSHIYLALGLWNDVIISNKLAWEAGIRNNHTHNAKYYRIDDVHALQWLSYAYLQTKQFKASAEILKIMESITLQNKVPMTVWYYSLMRSAYFIETKNFNARFKSITINNLEVSAKASNYYADALIALHHKDLKMAEEIYQKIMQLIPHNETLKNTSNDYFTSISSSGVRATKIILLELKSLLQIEKNQRMPALKLLEKAAKEENEISFGYGPPIPVQPSYELLAQEYIHQHDYQNAHKEYIISLKRMPNRLQSAQGLEKLIKILKAKHIPIPKGITPYYNKLMEPEYFH